MACTVIYIQLRKGADSMFDNNKPQEENKNSQSTLIKKTITIPP